MHTVGPGEPLKNAMRLDSSDNSSISSVAAFKGSSSSSSRICAMRNVRDQLKSRDHLIGGRKAYVLKYSD